MWIIDDFHDDNYSAFQLFSFAAYDYEISYNSNINLSLKSYQQKCIKKFFNSKESFIIVNNDSIEKITMPTENYIEIPSPFNYWKQVEFTTEDIHKDIEMINKNLSLIFDFNVLIVINLFNDKSNEVEEEFRSKNKRFKEIKFNYITKKIIKLPPELSEEIKEKILRDRGYISYSTTNLKIPPPPIEYILPISTTKPLF